MRLVWKVLAVAGLASATAGAASVITGPNSGIPRWHHGISLMADGRVLVFNGLTNATAPFVNTHTAQIYDPVMNLWSPGSLPTYAGSSFEVGLVGDGRVMSGDMDSFQVAPLVSPAWTALVPAPLQTRENAPLTPLPSGALLLSSGDFAGTPFALSERYDPATNTWFDAGVLSSSRTFATATVLLDGRVLVAGGSNANNVANVDLLNPATGAATTGPSLSVPRSGHCGTLLPDGTVLVVGGFNGTVATTVVERYSAPGNRWDAGASMATGRVNAVAALMPNGKLVVVGGYDHVNTYYATGETFDPGANTWTSDISVATPFAAARAVVLPNGRLFINGGRSSTAALDATLLIDTSQPSAAPAGALAANRAMPVLVSAMGGGVLGAGGVPGSEFFDETALSWSTTASPLAGTVLLGLALRDGRIWMLDDSGAAAAFDPDGGVWSSLAPAPNLRTLSAATTQADGTLLWVGGVNTDGGLSPEVDSFDPGTDSWTAAASLPQARSGHSVTRLLTGASLVVGGQTASGLTAAGALFNAGSWIAAGALSVARAGHTATLLLNGKVLVVGGNTGTAVTASAELYDPVSNAWTTAGVGTLATPRTGHAALLLQNGRVLIAGGASDVAQTQVLSSTELYDPVTGTFSAGPNLVTARVNPSAALLRDGRAVIAGGKSGAGTPLSATDVFDEGRGAQPAWAPILPAIHAAPGQAVVFNGTRLMGISSATCDNFAAGFANFPVLTLRGTSGDVWPAPVSSWDAGSATVTGPASVPVGLYTATVTVNGIPSIGAPFALGGVLGDTCSTPDACLSRACINTHCAPPPVYATGAADGGTVDGGSSADAGNAPDAGPGPDGGPGPDAGPGADGGGTRPGDASYYALRCDASPGGPLLWLAALALVLRRARQ